MGKHGKVTDWFTKIQDKNSCTFIQLDIEAFYPSISESILDNAINFGKENVQISYDGAGTCEIVGTYIRHKLADRIKKEDTGLYLDDRLILLHKHNRRQIDKARKDMTKIFKDIGFNIEIKTKLKK